MESDKLTPAERTNLENELKEIKTKLEGYQSRAFTMLLELIPIIAVPAAAALLVKKFLLADSGTGTTVLLVALALVTSWIIIFKRGLTLSRETGVLSRRRKEIKQLLGIPVAKPRLFHDELEAEKEKQQ